MQPKSSEIVDQIPSIQDGSITITTINDDCLVEIFSKLNATDMSAIKRCCRRFSAVIDLAAQRRYRNDLFEYCTSTDHGTTHRSCVTSLRDFGEHMHHIRINMDCFCKNYDRSQYGSPGFGRSVCSVKQILAELKHCINLKSLTLVGVQLYSVSTRQVSKVLRSLTHLETLQFIECVGNESNIARLIKSCKSLKNLTIRAEPMFSWTASVTDNILKSVSELGTIECISFETDDMRETFVENVMELRHLKKLKKLALNCGGKQQFDLASAIHALASTDSLEEIILIDLVNNDAIADALNEFSNLKSCIITSCSGMVDGIVHVDY